MESGEIGKSSGEITISRPAPPNDLCIVNNDTTYQPAKHHGSLHRPNPRSGIAQYTRAKRLLIYTDKSAKEITYELGFEELPHFSRFSRICSACRRPISNYNRRQICIRRRHPGADNQIIHQMEFRRMQGSIVILGQQNRAIE